jgi:tetratricopeptide (TPR) repeat protein
MRSVVACLALCAAACHRESATQPACDVASSDHDALYRRGTDLIEASARVSDRAPAPVRAADLRTGIACLDRALALRPTNWAAQWFRGKGYQSLGEHVAALDAFRAAFRLAPDQPDVGRELAVELLEVGQFDEAVEVATDLVTRHPDDAGLEANLGLALLLDGKLDAAKARVADALRRAPDDTVTQSLQRLIEEVASGARPPPRALADLER